MIKILKQGYCPICGNLIPHPAQVVISLSNNTNMPQPVCDNDFEKLLSQEYQEALLEECKKIWIDEISSSDQRTEEQKAKEIEMIEGLKVVYA